MTRGGPSGAPLADESGSVIVFVAASLALLVLVAAFVIDIGNAFEHKRHLQTQVDAAALAGAGRWQSCFGVGAGDAAVFGEATTYAGAAGTYQGVPYGTPAWNEQVGNAGKGVVTVLYQSAQWADGTADSDPPPATGPCSSPYILDVKATESSLPLLFSGVIPGVSTVAAINASARAQLFSIEAATPDLPLAVPDVNPKQVAVTFVDEDTQQELAGCTSANPLVRRVPGTACSFYLAKGSGSWSGLAAVRAPAGKGTPIGVRIGVGSAVGSCAGSSGGTGYVCYAYPSLTRGLVLIRGYDPALAASPNAPQLRAAWPTTTCATSPFFSDVTAPSGTCTAGLSAVVDFGSGNPANATVTATVNAASGTGGKQTATLTRGGDGVWRTAAGAFSLPVGAGAYDVTLDWKVGSSKGTLNGGKAIQRIYSADDDGSGPVKALDVSAYSLASGVADLTVSVTLKNSLQTAKACSGSGSGAGYDCSTDRPVRLRFASASGSQNYAVDCGTVPGHTGGDFYQQIRYGCAERFSINAPQVCPDPAAPDPTDCAPIGNFVGDKVGQAVQAMNDRFAPGNACTPNRYPTLDTGDPRIVTLIVTNFDAFGGSGGSGPGVPVVTYAAFYVTGWHGSDGSCAGVNEPPPAGGVVKGDIWGHFIKAVVDGGADPGTTTCNPDVNPCTPVLTR